MQRVHEQTKNAASFLLCSHQKQNVPKQAHKKADRSESKFSCSRVDAYKIAVQKICSLVCQRNS